MKFALALVGALLASSASAFDKWAPWGKRDYSCINIWQGIPENATVAIGHNIIISFNRDSGRCSEYLDDYAGSPYTLALYNNPVRVRDTVVWDERITIQQNINEYPGQVFMQVPTNLPQVNDDTVWYLRLDTVLADAPQMPSLFNALGPFRIRR